MNAAFRDKRFVDIEEEEIFKIEKSIDFFCYKNERICSWVRTENV